MNWIKQLNNWLKSKTFKLSGENHIFGLVIKPGQKVYFRTSCPKCGSRNAHIGVSTTNNRIFGVFCPKCHKTSFFTLQSGTLTKGVRLPITQGNGTTPIRCKAITASGKQCKNLAKSNGLCGVHAR